MVFNGVDFKLLKTNNIFFYSWVFLFFFTFSLVNQNCRHGPHDWDRLQADTEIESNQVHLHLLSHLLLWSMRCLQHFLLTFYQRVLQCFHHLRLVSFLNFYMFCLIPDWNCLFCFHLLLYWQILYKQHFENLLFFEHLLLTHPWQFLRDFAHYQLILQYFVRALLEILMHHHLKKTRVLVFVSKFINYMSTIFCMLMFFILMDPKEIYSSNS